MCNFDDEVAKGATSAIRTLKGGGCNEFTLRSVIDWINNTTNGNLTIRGLKENTENSKAAPKLHDDRRKSRQVNQERAILAAIEEKGHTPKELPKQIIGKPGIKAEVREVMDSNSFFAGETVFDKAWERLRKSGQVAETD